MLGAARTTVEGWVAESPADITDESVSTIGPRTTKVFPEERPVIYDRWQAPA
jgi:hypothetical protein